LLKYLCDLELIQIQTTILMQSVVPLVPEQWSNMQELAQIEDHGLSPPVVLAVKFIKSYIIM
jgi:hypothetical protein